VSGVTVTIDTASPLLARLQTAAQRAGLALVGARAVANLIKDHLVDLDAKRHEFGRHYYLQAARSVSSRDGGTGLGLVTVTQTGFMQRLFGGRIAAKSTTYLTIPACPEAYGHRAREFNDLEFKLALDDHGSLRPALVRRVSQAISLVRRKQSDGRVQTKVKAGDLRGGEVMFWLVRSVYQRPDPSVLPEADKMQSAATGAINTRIERLTGGAS
jgi:hypothetical protein